jgi:hypothetical protein
LRNTEKKKKTMMQKEPGNIQHAQGRKTAALDSQFFFLLVLLLSWVCSALLGRIKGSSKETISRKRTRIRMAQPRN